MMKEIASSPARSFALVFLLSMAVRGFLFPLTPEELIRDPGSEMGRIARSLAATGEFANPYAVPTGPTAHLPPVHAGFVGLIYVLFGVTATADHVRCLFVIASFSAMYAFLPWLAGRLGARPEAGLLGGLAGALTPRWPMEVCLGWEEPYAAIVLGLLLVAFLERSNKPFNSATGTFWLGAAAGAAFHLAPTLLPVVLGCLAFELWHRRGGQALEWTRTRPGAFLRLTAWRIVHFWFGAPQRPIAALWTSTITLLAVLGAWRLLSMMAAPQRAALLIPLATYPLVYYVLGSAYRYRVPVYGILLILAGSAFFRRARPLWHHRSEPGNGP